MNKELEKVLNEVRKQMQTTVISYEKRDPEGIVWGKSSYNGNCSGKVPLGFIDKLGAKNICELYAGSGTLSDVCRDYGFSYKGIDLNPNPVRDNIISMDICDLSQDLPKEFYEADMVFSHPPYPGINYIKYANSAWKDTVGGLSERDIQNMSFEEGMQKINLSTMRAYAAIPEGSYIVLLVGEIRSNGKYYSMYNNLCLPGEHFQTYVKIQHNTTSGRNGVNYGKNPRALTAQEMIAVVKKPLSSSSYVICYVVPKKYELDMRDSVNTVTWKDAVLGVLRNLKSATNEQMYKEFETHTKARNNPNYKAKLRQTLQILAKEGLAIHVSEGNWRVA